jgi:hypothetical protein
VIIDFYPPIRIGTRSARTGGLGGKNFKFQVLQAFFIRAICVIRELLLKSDAMADRMSILEKPDNLKSVAPGVAYAKVGNLKLSMSKSTHGNVHFAPSPGNNHLIHLT